MKKKVALATPNNYKKSPKNYRYLQRGLSSRSGTVGEHGSGLGLIVCKELIEKHDGTLHVESEEGKGSRFWFVLK